MKKLIIALSALTLLVTACSSPSTSPAASADRTAEAEPAPNVKAQVLKVTDLPAGWSVDNSSDDSGGGPSGCGLDNSSSKDPQANASFAKGGSLPVFAESIVYVGSGAQAAYERGVKALDHCKSLNLGGSTGALGSSSQGTKITVGRMSFPTFGDQSAAYAMTASVEGFNVTFDLVIVREAQEITLLMYGDLGSVVASDLEPFVKLAVRKVEAHPAA